MSQPELRVLITHLGTAGGGPKFHFYLFSSFLARQSVEAHYLISSEADNASHFRSTGSPHLTIPTYRTKRQLLLGLLTLPVSVMRLRSYIKTQKITVVINSMESIYQGLMAKVAIPAGVKYVSCVHDADDHPGDGHPLKMLSRLGERSRADEFVVFSESVGVALGKKSFVRGRPIRQTVHGVFGSETSPRQRSVTAADALLPVRIGFLGRLGKYKGLDILAEATKILDTRGRNISVSIHGSGPEARLARTELGSTCHWEIGWIADEDIPSILDSFDILALPYREASQSGVIAYALSRGVPIVATPVGGLREQVIGTGSGLIARSTSAVDFADALEVLVTDSKLRSALSRNALEASRTTHSWERVGDDFAKWLAC